jgi:formate--tetrahydrofolate ligase
MTTPMLPLRTIAERLGLKDKQLAYYSEHIAKLKLDLLSDDTRRGKGKLIMVTAMTPTSHGEGKTVVSIGLTQTLARQARFQA